MKTPRTKAALRAVSRDFEFSRMEKYIGRTGRENWRRLFKTSCVACGVEFETQGGIAEGKDRKAFAYSLNWRCQACRSPRAIEKGHQGTRAIMKAALARKAERLGVADLV